MPSLGEILRGVGGGLKRLPIGEMLQSGMAAAATPNVAGGGPTDTIRGILSGMQYPEAMRRQKAEEEAANRARNAQALRDEAYAASLGGPEEPKDELGRLLKALSDPMTPPEQLPTIQDRIDQLTGKAQARTQERLEKAEMERLAKQDRDRRDARVKAEAAEERANRKELETAYKENRAARRLENPPGAQVLPPDVEAQRIRMSKASRSASTGETQARFDAQQLDEAVKEQEKLQADEQKQHAIREQLGEALKTPEGKTFIDPESLMSDITMTPQRRGNLKSRFDAATRQVEFLQRRQKAIQAKFGGRSAEGAGKGKLSDPALAQEYLRRAGGDKGKARSLAQADGWTL